MKWLHFIQKNKIKFTLNPTLLVDEQKYSPKAASKFNVKPKFAPVPKIIKKKTVKKPQKT